MNRQSNSEMKQEVINELFNTLAEICRGFFGYPINQRIYHGELCFQYASVF